MEVVLKSFFLFWGGFLFGFGYTLWFLKYNAIRCALKENKMFEIQK